MIRFALCVALGLLALDLGGCTGGISRELREQAAPLQDFAELQANVDEYRGRIVILGGEIIQTRNHQDHSTLVVLQRPLGWDKQPERDEEGTGRFLVRVDRFLDPAVFSSGRLVTVAGEVAGTETESIGEARYRYVVLQGRELHLWRESTGPEYPYYYGYPYYYDPFFDDPFFYPHPFFLRHRRW